MRRPASPAPPSASAGIAPEGSPAGWWPPAHVAAAAPPGPWRPPPPDPPSSCRTPAGAPRTPRDRLHRGRRGGTLRSAAHAGLPWPSAPLRWCVSRRRRYSPVPGALTLPVAAIVELAKAFLGPVEQHPQVLPV